jgi:hypothetical protein
VEDLERDRAARRTRALDEARTERTAELEAAQAKLEDARDESFLLGFAAGYDANPLRVTFRGPS